MMSQCTGVVKPPGVLSIYMVSDPPLSTQNVVEREDKAKGDREAPSTVLDIDVVFSQVRGQGHNTLVSLHLNPSLAECSRHGWEWRKHRQSREAYTIMSAFLLLVL
jgi:hypothetical protein